ncbi:MAG TPA: TMEM165/GDT1 family protein [Acidimicrobiales bacterium]|nr:TMEM165/GDT1 family protein [Acidimicrobiales bacterium]
MQLSVIATVFPLIFLAELPDKTMFASLVLATRGRPLAVWVGASLAFAAHVVIAVSIGVALFNVLPHRVVEIVVAALFAAGALYSYLSRNATEGEEEARIRSTGAALLSAAGVIFLAEWGDLTQILTANLAARYHSWLSVAVGAQAALMAVAGVAVLSGTHLLARVPVKVLRLITAAVLLVLAAYTLIQAL